MKSQKIIVRTVTVLGILVLTFIIVIIIWVYVLTVRSNDRFKTSSDSALIMASLPPGAELIRDEIHKKAMFDIDVGPSRRVTYKLDGYSRQQVADIFGSDSPVQEIKYKYDDVTVQVDMWPAPDWGRELEIGRTEFRKELTSLPVDELIIEIR